MKNVYQFRAFAILAGAMNGVAIFLSPTPCLGQGATITFNNRLPGVVVAPIYGVEPVDAGLCKQGNTAAGTPQETQVYGGSLLGGPGYTAELWFEPGAGPEDNLVPLVPRTTFQTTPTLAGFIIPVTVMLPAIPPLSTLSLQMRVWDNRGGAVNSWEMALADRTVPRGMSRVWTAVLPEPGMPPPGSVMGGLRSFNLCVPIVPPTIVTPPVSQVVSAGTPVCFSVVAAGDSPFHYQWRFNNEIIPAATNTTYSIAHVAATHVGIYTVTVSNLAGSIDSQPASLALLGLQVCALLTLEGSVGSNYRIDYSPEMTNPPVWTPLETITLTTSPYHYIDWGSSGAAKRYYRIVPLP